MKSIAIIPARSGSKGLPDKNIIELNGTPLMGYTIKAAKESNCFDEIMVSTDALEYKHIAEECGASVPFLRSSEFSSDTAGSWDVVREVLEQYENIGLEFDYVCLLQPTSPLRSADDIKKCFDILRRSEVNNVVSVVEVEHPVQWCFKLPQNGSMSEMANSPYSYMRRQELETYYRENGAIYLVEANKIKNSSYNLYQDNCYAYVMPMEKSIDIDNRIDLVVAKSLLLDSGE